jgi:hypothetical protein
VGQSAPIVLIEDFRVSGVSIKGLKPFT